ncbi:MFS transporter [Pacificimonas flava]|uniref:MFS transporter n=2 Tax=Pacificimonas TaxID=1960290 RepID=A0A219B9J7_9SPHN|nr:MFS transporter [Pacificimonas aurantium]OWV34796.1 MFS transporter [Pacificimonas flava]
MTTGIVVANAYYIHPVIALVAEGFGVTAAMIGLVPALNQLALAVGIFLFLPLGDRMGNARLARIFVALQLVCVLGMAVAGEFYLFVAASTLLGLVTIAPYLIPTYVSKRVDPKELGKAQALLTVGIIVGILFARLGGGILGEYFGWRAVFYAAAAAMLTIAAVLPVVMPKRSGGPPPQGSLSYAGLLASTFPIARSHPVVLMSGTIQGLNFGVFLALWLGIGLHLPDIGYGVDMVGYLAGFSIINLATTPFLGAWADRVGALRARALLSAGQLAGVLLLFLADESFWVLCIPIVIFNLVGPVIDVSGRMTFLALEPDIRTRLMTVYIILMFIGGGLGSWLGTAAYDWVGWTGTCLLTLVLSLAIVTLSFVAWRRTPAHAAP